MMKSDVMDDFEQLKVCTRYAFKGEFIDKITFESISQPVVPHYETLEGWNTSIRHHVDKNQLPRLFRDYITYIEDHVKLPVSIVSLGPGREHTLLRK